MGDNGSAQRGLPPVKISDEEIEKLGLNATGLHGRTARRSDLDFTRVAQVPLDLAIQVTDPGERQQIMANTQNQVMAMAGLEIVRIIIANPQSRLIPVPFTVRSVRHAIDFRVAFWELLPAEGKLIRHKGKWGLGMHFTPEKRIPGDPIGIVPFPGANMKPACPACKSENTKGGVCQDCDCSL
jgi:hypothetical protein